MKPKNNNDFITLKKASEISGYDPDYIGQLIRKGKIPGKQVFRTVAWLTTEQDIRRYMENAREGGRRKTFRDRLFDLKHKLRREGKYLRIILYFLISVLGGFSIFLFYIFSVHLEIRLREKAVLPQEEIILETQPLFIQDKEPF